MRQDQETSPEERIKELIEFEEDKRKELEDKKAELEAKKKELEELEKVGEEEIDSAREELQKKIEELAIRQRRLLLEEERVKNKKEEAEKERLDLNQQQNQRRRNERNLEETVFSEPTQELPRQRMRGYTDAITSIMNGNPTFYDITNYNVVNKLEAIASKVGERPLTKAEKDFIGIVEYHAKGLAQEYQNNDSAVYVAKELAQIDFINKIARKNNEGDYSQ